jgi:hypothetical protein
MVTGQVSKHVADSYAQHPRLDRQVRIDGRAGEIEAGASILGSPGPQERIDREQVGRGA